MCRHLSFDDQNMVISCSSTDNVVNLTIFLDDVHWADLSIFSQPQELKVLGLRLVSRTPTSPRNCKGQ